MYIPVRVCLCARVMYVRCTLGSVSADGSVWDVLVSGDILRRLVQLISASDSESRLGACMILSKLAQGVNVLLQFFYVALLPALPLM